MPVGAAIGGGAALGAGASLYGSKKQGESAGDASDAQAQSAAESIAFQRESRDLARSDLSPFVNCATGSMNQSGQGIAQQGGVQSATPQNIDRSNFNAQAYLAANPDVMQALSEGKWKTKDKEGAAWSHYQMFGMNEGRKFTPIYGVTNPGSGTFASDSPLGRLSAILTPGGQMDYLKSNPLFTTALENVNRQSNNTFLGRGKVGDATGQLVNNAYLAGLPLLQNQTANLFNAANLGQSSAAGQANAALTSGAGISNTLEGAGNARAAGYIGQGNAQAQGLYGATNALGQGLGAYAMFNQPSGAFGGMDATDRLVASQGVR